MSKSSPSVISQSAMHSTASERPTVPFLRTSHTKRLTSEHLADAICVVTFSPLTLRKLRLTHAPKRSVGVSVTPGHLRRQNRRCVPRAPAASIFAASGVQCRRPKFTLSHHRHELKEGLLMQILYFNVAVYCLRSG
jgi:hypothetical protein